MKTYTIYNTDVLQYDEADIRETLMMSNIPESEITEDKIWKTRYEWQELDNEEFWDDIRRANDVVENDGFAIIADLGLWYGRRDAWQTARTLKDAILKCIKDMDDWKVEETSYGKLLVTGYHHDGTNVYEIYRLKEGKYDEYQKPAKRDYLNVHLRKALGWI